MPNHVHVLLQSLNGWTIAKIVGTWKKFTARRIMEINSQPIMATRLHPPIWHREYWDRFVRNEEHYARVVDYIEQNPVKAGLAADAEAWPWSSAYARRDVQR
jgi:REP element-mobilizing transposase RayT